MMKQSLKALLLWLPLLSFANVQGDLGGFFDNLGYEGNVSSSNAWEAQGAGYYSGGSAYLRNQVRNVQLVHVDLPSMKGGCGGIDAYLGGLSYIQGDALQNLSKAIINAGESYAFDLALETSVPEIKHVKDVLEDIEQKANASNINSCEMAQDLVGGVWPETQASQQRICQDVGTHAGIFSDFTQARQECAGSSGFDEAMQAAKADPQYKDAVIVDKNLVWDALKKQEFLSADTELAELVMSLTGTIIFDADAKATEVASMIDSQSLVKALMHGGDAPVWVCDNDDTCLHVSEGSAHIDESKGLVNQVSELMVQLIDSVALDEPLTDEEKGFVNSTSIPVLKAITVLSNSPSGVSPTMLLPYSELIAEDLLEQYLMELLKAEKTALSGTSYPPELQASLMAHIQEAQQVIAKMMQETQGKVQNNMALIENLKSVEKTVSSYLSSNLKPDLATGAAS